MVKLAKKCKAVSRSGKLIRSNQPKVACMAHESIEIYDLQSKLIDTIRPGSCALAIYAPPLISLRKRDEYRADPLKYLSRSSGELCMFYVYEVLSTEKTKERQKEHASDIGFALVARIMPAAYLLSSDALREQGLNATDLIISDCCYTVEIDCIFSSVAVEYSAERNNFSVPWLAAAVKSRCNLSMWLDNRRCLMTEDVHLMRGDESEFLCGVLTIAQDVGCFDCRFDTNDQALEAGKNLVCGTLPSQHQSCLVNMIEKKRLDDAALTKSYITAFHAVVQSEKNRAAYFSDRHRLFAQGQDISPLRSILDFVIDTKVKALEALNQVSEQVGLERAKALHSVCWHQYCQHEPLATQQILMHELAKENLV